MFKFETEKFKVNHGFLRLTAIVCELLVDFGNIILTVMII